MGLRSEVRQDLQGDVFRVVLGRRQRRQPCLCKLPGSLGIQIAWTYTK